VQLGFPAEVLDQAPEAIAVLTRQGRCRYVNAAAERLLGRARYALLGHAPWEALESLAGGPLHQALERVAATGQAESFEYLHAPSQQWLDVRVYATAEALWLVAADVTGRKAATLQQQAANARLRVLAEASRALSAAKLDVDEVLRTVTRQVVAHLADSCSLALVSENGQWLDPVAHDDAVPEYRAAYAEMTARSRIRMGEGVTGRAAQSGQPLLLPRVSREQLAQAVKPEYRQLLLPSESYSILVVPLSITGRVIGTLQCARRSPRPAFDGEDEQLLRELADRAAFAIANARLHAQALTQARVLDSMAEGVCATGEDGIIRYTNPAMDRMFGYAPGELVGRHVTALNTYPPEENARRVGAMMDELNARGEWAGEWSNVRKDGTAFVTRGRVTQVELGEGRHWVSVQQDVTAQLRAEAERAALLEAERQARAHAERTAGFALRLQQVTRLLGQALSGPQAAEALLEQGVAALEAANGGIWLLDAASERLELKHSRGYSAEGARDFASFPVDAPLPVAEVVRRGESIWLRNWNEYAARTPAAGELGSGRRHRQGMAFAALPLRVEGRVIGAVAFGFQGERGFEDFERWFVEILTQHAAQALDRARLFEAQFVTRGRLEAIVSSSPAAIILLELDGTVRLWNAAAERIFGWTEAEVLGQLNPIVPSAGWEAFLDALRRMAQGETLGGLELRRRTKERGVIDVSVHAAPVRMPDGRIQCLSVVTDITERKRAEARTHFLAEASTLLSSSLDYERTLYAVAHVAVPVLADWCTVHLLDTDGRVRSVAAAHLNPARTEQALDFHRRYPVDLKAQGGIGKVLRTGEPELVKHLPEALIHATIPDSERREAALALGIRSLVSVPLRSRGRVIGALTLVYADSDRRYTEADLRLAEELALRASTAIDNATLYLEAREAVEARDIFLGVASHELNTPLTSLKLQLQGLQRTLQSQAPDALPRQGLDAKFQSTQRQLSRLASLVRELLDVSRITAGKLKLEPEDMDLAALVREVASRATEDAARAGSELRLSVPETVPGSWDRLRMDQVLQNLLSNALKYGHGQPVDVALEAGADTVTLRVTDRGLGIAPEDQPRLFQKFQRVASERHYSGFGLGLWIVKQVLDAMGGTIQVESAPGQGATFTVSLPRGGAAPTA
jgi:PAS domain S-box-containing protein